MEAAPAPLGKAGGMPDTVSAEIRFREIYEEHYGAILAYCRRRTGHADAHDAAAEVFAIAWRKIDTLVDQNPVRPWLYGVAYRVLSHQWRARDRFERLRDRVGRMALPWSQTPESNVVSRSDRELVLEAARCLSHNDREILRLAAWEELPHSEIARILEISTAAVDQRFHRAKKRLAAEYERISMHRPPASAAKGGRA